MSFINVSHISKTFKVAKKQSGFKATLKNFIKREYKYIDAIKDISFNIEEGSIVGYIGQNGAGKSTLLNALDNSLNLKTGDFSFSLGRGKHTTREVEFMEICGGLVADPPGFSSLKLDIDSARLSCIYPGFKNFGECKFRGCKHDKEIGCKIKNDVDNGIILRESYENYLRLLKDISGGKKI